MKIIICLFFILIKIAFSQNSDNIYFMTKINSYRINAGLEKYKFNKELQEIADIIAYMYASGENVSSSGNIKELFKNINLNISYYYHNEIKGNGSINDLFNYFIEKNMSNILSEDYNYVSFGIYNDGSYNYVVSLYALEIDIEKEIKIVAELVNKVRKENGIKLDLKLDNELTKAAIKRGEELTEFYSHIRPNGKDFFTVLNEFNIASYSICGENIARGQRNGESVMEAWLNSTVHRANILNENFNYIGIGLFLYEGKSYWVQIFLKD